MPSPPTTSPTSPSATSAASPPQTSNSPPATSPSPPTAPPPCPRRRLQHRTHQHQQQPRHRHRAGEQRHHANPHPPCLQRRPERHRLLPRELDFGIQTATSPIATRTVTVTNLSSSPQTFPSQLGSNQSTAYTFAESSSDCPSPTANTKTLAPNSACHITLSFTPATTSTNDGFAQIPWTIGTDSALLTAYTQATDLNLSATEIDFGTQFGTGSDASPTLPRYLYLSNNSANAVTHSPVSLAAPFTLTDHCPTTLEPHTVCQLEITYKSPVAPSADSTTLTLDEGLTVLITGSTHPQPTGIGQSANPNLTVTPSIIKFPNAVLVTSTSSTTQTVTIGNIGAVAFPLALTLTGDFTDATDCTATLAANSTCTVVLTFAPSQPGTRQGLLSVTAGSSSPSYVTLSGTGTAIVTAPNNTLAFGSVLVGQPSVQWYKVNSPSTPSPPPPPRPTSKPSS
ncbi:choice-of-anchor D domain-containing protein [Tunturiibacter gelidiferens]|uniref:choice-of-anchor D domain-containing protein n=1 Tax=Tunturiibacter gelidiferens TaxID=3069689 RepID=UPI003D9AE90D